MEPRNRFQGMNSASLCGLAGRYENPIPTRCLAPIECLKIPAQATEAGGIDSLESIPGLVRSLKIRPLKATGGRKVWFISTWLILRAKHGKITGHAKKMCGQRSKEILLWKVIFDYSVLAMDKDGKAIQCNCWSNLPEVKFIFNRKKIFTRH